MSAIRYEVYVTQLGKLTPLRGTKQTVLGWPNARKVAAETADVYRTAGYTVVFHGELFFDWCMYDMNKGRTSELQVRVARQ